MTPTALVIGATGIAGYACSNALLNAGYRVLGLSRTPRYEIKGVEQVYADLFDPDSLEKALAAHKVTHLVFTAWQRRQTEAENCAANSTMLKNAIETAVRSGELSHVTLITGLKYYLGPFEAYAKSAPETPFREEQGRLPYENFYYVQEDLLADLGSRYGFSWTVLRPHTLIGYALGNVMNMGVTLSLYGSICRFTGRPFVFPGSPQQWQGVTDITDSRLLGRQVVWAFATPSARNQAFNSVNGDVFRWRWMWKQIAYELGVEPAEYPGHPSPLEEQMAEADDVWSRIVQQYDLKPYRASELASWWHTDADLGRPIEAFASMNKSRASGFLEYQDSLESFRDLFQLLRAARIIPPAA